jgi:lysophospholipase L1-like esterase
MVEERRTRFSEVGRYGTYPFITNQSIGDKYMKTILCYGDSNTWGWDPLSMERYPADTRWPGVLQHILGQGYQVIEEGLPGRTTVWTDPIEGHMSGQDYLTPCLDSHRPLDLVILMLGTNDLKYRFSVSAFDIAESLGALVKIIHQSESGPDMGIPKILLLAPPPLGKLTDFGDMFAGGTEKSRQLSQHIQRGADLWGCAFLDTAQVIVSSDIDGVHLDAGEHRKLGKAVAEIVVKMAM